MRCHNSDECNRLNPEHIHCLIGVGKMLRKPFLALEDIPGLATNTFSNLN
jgi:hypothetical protein